MLTFQDLMSQYWKYYLALETRLLETERYVEFDLSNGTVYSMEYMMLFQTICSEIDVVGKVYAGICEPSFKANKRTGLNEWWFCVTKNNPELVDKSILFRNKLNFSRGRITVLESILIKKVKNSFWKKTQGLRLGGMHIMVLNMIDLEIMEIIIKMPAFKMC